MKKEIPQLLLVVLCIFITMGAMAQRRGNLASSVGISGGYVEDGLWALSISTRTGTNIFN